MIDVDDELLAKALLMNSRTRWRSRGLKGLRDLDKATEFKRHEPAAAINKMWRVPANHPWMPQRQTWINEARSLKAAIAALSKRKRPSVRRRV